MVLQRDRPGNVLADPVRHQHHLLRTGQVRQNNHKVVATDACRRVTLTQLLADALGHSTQNGVSEGVSQAVIDALEMVQIEVENGHSAPVALRKGDGQFGALLEPVAVGQPRQLVVIVLPLQLFLVLLAVRDVIEDSDKMRHFALVVAHRRNRQVIPEQGAVLAVVAQDGVALALLSQGRRDFLHAHLLAIGLHQQVRALPRGLLETVARDALKSRVGMNDSPALGRVRKDHNAIGRRLDGTAVEADRLFADTQALFRLAATRLLLEVRKRKADITHHFGEQIQPLRIEEVFFCRKQRETPRHLVVHRQQKAGTGKKSVLQQIGVNEAKPGIGEQIVADVGLAQRQRQLCRDPGRPLCSYGCQAHKPVWRHAAARRRHHLAGLRIQQTHPGHAQPPTLDSDGAQPLQQFFPVPGMHDGLVGFTQGGIEPVQAQDLLVGRVKLQQALLEFQAALLQLVYQHLVVHLEHRRA